MKRRRGDKAEGRDFSRHGHVAREQIFKIQPLYKDMKFRQYVKENATALLNEADLLAAPSSAATDTGSASLAEPGPSQGSRAADPQPPESDGTPLGSGRPPDAMDKQLRKAATMATELMKTLLVLPHPWNKGFAMFLRPLKALVARLEEIS